MIRKKYVVYPKPEWMLTTDTGLPVPIVPFGDSNRFEGDEVEEKTKEVKGKADPKAKKNKPAEGKLLKRLL